MAEKDYNASSIKVLKGLDAVRKRPGMYIGATDVNGLHHLVWEIVDNSIDEVLAGYAKNVRVTIKADNSVVVEDDGRGIPVDMHENSSRTAVEIIFTELHSGGKFGSNDSAYSVSGGLHGVGASVVNALSDRLEVHVYRNGSDYETVFIAGHVKQKTTVVGPSQKRGTLVHFWPSYSMFKNATLSYERIKERLQESSFLINGLKIQLSDERTGAYDEFEAHDGVKEFVQFITESKTIITKAYKFSAKDDESKIISDIGFQYTDDYTELILSFVNNIKTREGGDHELGFKTAWTKVINDYARQHNLLKTKDDNLDGEDIREGLVAIISLKIPEKILEFVGQTKDKLRSNQARRAVEVVIENQLRFWLQEHKDEANKIVSKAIGARHAREAARKARSEARSIKKSLTEARILSGKLTPAQSRMPQERELFLVEGDSAGGSAKLGRDRRYQAILPLRGKIINTEKARLVDILNNEEIATIVNAVGVGVGDEFKIADLQYGKIIIMTDADTDGAHIQTLLMTFFFRYMRPLIQAGVIYVAVPPLFKVAKTEGNKKREFYVWEEQELKTLISKEKNLEIQRYKGLGEMNSEQLWETTMNPKTRTLIRVDIPDAALAERRVSTLMGDKVEPRKDWINANVNFSLEDDFIVRSK